MQKSGTEEPKNERGFHVKYWKYFEVSASVKPYRFIKILIVAAIAITVLLPSSLASAHTKHSDPKNRVVVFSLPRLTWEMLQSGTTPNIDSLITRGSTAALSVKVIGTPMMSKSYATLSAGLRATAVDSYSANFFAPSEIVDGQSAQSIYEAQRGPVKVKNPAALGLGFQSVIRANTQSLNEATVGLLADTLKKNDRTIAALGNSDTCLEDSSSCYDRAVGYFATDSQGIMQEGDISRDLLSRARESKSTQPSMDMGELRKKATASLKKNDVTVVECSDLERIDAARTRTKESISNTNFQNALTKCDSLIGDVVSSLSLSRDQVFVLSPASPRELEQTTVFVAAGKGIPRGYASSATTRVEGIVSIVDIAPTILHSFNINRPDDMGDTLLDWRKNNISNSSRENHLIDINDVAVAREEVSLPATWFVGIVFVATVLIAMIAFTRVKKWKTLARFACFTTLSLPILTYLIQPAMTSLDRPVRIISVLGLLALICATALTFVARKWGLLVAVASLAATNIVVFVIDILFGGRLQFNSVFGNGTILAGRFAGWGNSTFAFVGVSALVFIAMIKEITHAADEKTTKRINLSLLALLLVIIILDGAPYFGADVGGILALTPITILVGMMLYEKRIGVKVVIWSVVATGGALVAAALVDLARPVAQRTHLGRFAESVIEGTAGVTIRRKMTASLDSFHRPELMIVVLVSILFLAYLVFNRNRYFDKTTRAFPSLKFLITPGIVLAVLGTLLNDSGVSIPSRMLIIAIPVITLLALKVSETDAMQSVESDK